VTAFAGGTATLAHQFTGAETPLECASLVIVGARLANDALHAALAARARRSSPAPESGR
jgi:dimethylamine/trimethylamine dehydrogenase